MSSEINRLLQEAIALAQSGQRDEARQLLEQVLEHDPTQIAAWLWLGTVANSQDERIRALLRVVELDPSNATARAALQKLGISIPSWTQADPLQPAKSREPILSQRELMIVLSVILGAILLLLSFLVGREVVAELSNTPTPTLTLTYTPSPTFTATFTPPPTNTFPPPLTLPPSFTPSITPSVTLTFTPRPTWTRIPSRTPIPTRTPAPTRDIEELTEVFGG